MKSCDQLNAKHYLQFRSGALTFTKIKMVFTVLMCKTPKAPEKIPLASTADGKHVNMVTEGTEKPVKIWCIFSYYYGLRVLMNCFGYVGNFKVASKLFANDPSKKQQV